MTDQAAALTRLTDALRRAHYSGPLDVAALAKGAPSGFLPLLHFALLGASRLVAAWLAEGGSGLSPAMSDARFVECTHRLLRDQMSYRPALTVQQLLTASGFADKKMLLVVDVLKLCSTRHSALLLEAKRRTAAACPSPRTGASPRPSSARTPRTRSAGGSRGAHAAVISSELRMAPPSPVELLPNSLPPARRFPMVLERGSTVPTSR